MSILYNLFGSVLGFIYEIVNNYGLSIIIFAIFAKLITIPFTIKSTKSMQMMKVINPEIQKIQEKYKNNKEKQGEEMWKIYEKYNYNPLSGCMPLLLQFPIIIGLFGVLRNPQLYVFKEGMTDVSMSFLWIKDLSLSATNVSSTSGFGLELALYCILPVLVVIFTYLQQKQTPQTTQAAGMATMNIFLVAMIGYSSMIFTQALALYWLLQTALGVIQTYIMNKYIPVSTPEVMNNGKKSIK